MSNSVIHATFGQRKTEAEKPAVELREARQTMNSSAPSKGRTIALWIARLGAAGIMIMGALPKFFNFTETGTLPLAEALGVGRGVITGMGVMELLAGVLLIVGATRAVGALLTAGIMVGALMAHATVIGFSGSAAAEMWPLAILALLLSGAVLLITRKELPIVGGKL